jgi:hypothetical protein
MNTRLKELFKQASTAPWHPDDVGSLDAEKFAELIIQECADIADTMDSVRKETFHRKDGSQIMLGNVLKQHFGIKS